MGGGMGTGFGKTSGNTENVDLDKLNKLLAILSLIPGIDTFVDLAAIPVDIARGDYVGAALDAFGAIPFIGEIADTGKIIKTVDNVIDASKVSKKATKFSDFPTTVHNGRQGKHIIGHNNYIEGKSIFSGTTNDANKLIKKFSGTGNKKGPNKELVDFGKTIGTYVDPQSNVHKPTTKGIIHYSKDGAHIVPARP